jgi:hypothetical protein
MKWLSLILLLGGCGFFVEYEDVLLDLPVVASVEEAWDIAASVRLVSEPDGMDIWKEPRATYRDMTGDCEDATALFVALVQKAGLGTAYIAVIKLYEGETYHAVAEINGRLCETQIPGRYYPSFTKIHYRYSLNEYVWHRSLEDV